MWGGASKIDGGERETPCSGHSPFPQTPPFGGSGCTIPNPYARRPIRNTFGSGSDLNDRLRPQPITTVAGKKRAREDEGAFYHRPPHCVPDPCEGSDPINGLPRDPNRSLCISGPTTGPDHLQPYFRPNLYKSLFSSFGQPGGRTGGSGAIANNVTRHPSSARASKCGCLESCRRLS